VCVCKSFKEKWKNGQSPQNRQMKVLKKKKKRAYDANKCSINQCRVILAKHARNF